MYLESIELCTLNQSSHHEVVLSFPYFIDQIQTINFLTCQFTEVPIYPAFLQHQFVWDLLFLLYTRLFLVVFLDSTPAGVFSHDLQTCQTENVIYTNPASLMLSSLASGAGKSDIELIPSIDLAHF